MNIVFRKVLQSALNGWRGDASIASKIRFFANSAGSIQIEEVTDRTIQLS